MAGICARRHIENEELRSSLIRASGRIHEDIVIAAPGAAHLHFAPLRKPHIHQLEIALNFQDQLRYNLAAGPHYEPDEKPIELPSNIPARLIAFYLPQFHAIAENDAWWGKGFTEWTNVTKALPQFEGHYQPHLPTATGFYDLRHPDVMRDQWEMAARHGIQGFCFHYYWFSGRKVLETPLSTLLQNPNITMPFCINWANENWTRTWDGSEREILLQQHYSDAEDLAFIEDLLPVLRDPRYIRVGDRPLVMIYQPALLPNPMATLAKWRQRVVESGLAEPFFVMPQAFGNDDPRPLGFDAVVGFPPHKFGAEIRDQRLATKSYDNAFAGEVYQYQTLAAQAAAYDPEEFTLFPGVCPAWDNAARRPNRGLTFAGSTPGIYGDWLESACRKVRRRNHEQQRFVFINAWNEWAEGAHLEPDRHNGFAYLRETTRVLAKVAAETSTVSASTTLTPKSRRFVDRRQHDRVRVLIHRVRNKLAATAETIANTLRP